MTKNEIQTLGKYNYCSSNFHFGQISLCILGNVNARSDHDTLQHLIFITPFSGKNTLSVQVDN